MRELLLGYLMGALEDSERQLIERRLEEDPQLRRDLEALAARLEPLEAAREQFEPPAGLAASTCRLVQAYADAPSIEPARRQAALSRGGDSGSTVSHARRWTLADFVVAGGICLAGALLFIPAIAASQDTANRLKCQYNLQRIGLALTEYSRRHDGRFPQVPTQGNRAAAGIYGPVLLQECYLTDSGALVCPSSSLAQQRAEWRMPSLDEIDLAQGAELVRLQQAMGGSYGYNLGYVDNNGRLRAPRNEGRAHYALLSDAPSAAASSSSAAGVLAAIRANHGGRGVNLLYEDGHVNFLVGDAGDHFDDHPFVNRLGLTEAGLDRDDAVLAGSGTPPIPVQKVGLFR